MSNPLLAYNLNTAYLTGLKSQKQKELKIVRTEETTKFYTDGRSYLESDLKKTIGANNNMELLSKYISGTVENTKYFNYYKPDSKKPISLLSELTQNISTVEALDAEYLKQDGYRI